MEPCDHACAAVAVIAVAIPAQSATDGLADAIDQALAAESAALAFYTDAAATYNPADPFDKLADRAVRATFYSTIPRGQGHPRPRFFPPCYPVS